MDLDTGKCPVPATTVYTVRVPQQSTMPSELRDAEDFPPRTRIEVCAGVVRLITTMTALFQLHLQQAAEFNEIPGHDHEKRGNATFTLGSTTTTPVNNTSTNHGSQGCACGACTVNNLVRLKLRKKEEEDGEIA